MNANTLAKMAYSGRAAPTRTARSIEYELFARITHRLKVHAEKGALGFALLAEALHDNLCLWTTLATDVAEPTNGLPQTLRARIFYLAEFTRSHTPRILAGAATSDVLIDINTAVMKGLRTEGERG